jgi:hypothetical protein
MVSSTHDMVATWLHESMLISCPFPNIWNFHTCRIQAQTTQANIYHLEGDRASQVSCPAWSAFLIRRVCWL